MVLGKTARQSLESQQTNGSQEKLVGEPESRLGQARRRLRHQRNPLPGDAGPLVNAAVRGSASDHAVQFPVRDAYVYRRFGKLIASSGRASPSQRELETAVCRFRGALGSAGANVDSHANRRAPVLLNGAHAR